MSDWPSPLVAVANFSFQSVNFPDRYVRHQNGLGELTPIAAVLDQLDASFWILPSLADDNSGPCISFRSVNYPFSFLRHQDFRIKLAEPPASGPASGDGMLFAQDAAFVEVPGFAAPNSYSFRSVNYPDRYIRHRDFHLYVEPFAGPAADFAFYRKPSFVPVVPFGQH